LGYDFSINFGGRTNPKPIRWNYYMEPERQRLYKATAAMIKLKTDNIAFRTSTYDLDVWGTGKRMWVSDPSMNVTVIGNIGVDSLNTMMPGFQHTGPWYDYMTGDTFIINNVNDPIPLGPGDYHIFTDVKLPPPDLTVPVGVESPTDGTWTEGIESMAYPNPFNEEIVIRYTLPDNLPVQVCIYDALGRTVKHLVDEPQMSGRQFVVWDGLRADGQPAANGFYYYVVTQGQHKSSKQILKAN